MNNPSDKTDRPKDAKPALRDDGVLSPNHFESLPPSAKHVTTGKPVLLPEVILGDTIIRHRI
jgi:hypothetical protein